MKKWTRAAAGLLAALTLAVPCAAYAGDEAYFAQQNTHAVRVEAGEDGRQYLCGLHVLDDAAVSRFSGTEFAPVPKRSEVFAADGTPLADSTPAATGQTLRIFLGRKELQRYTVVVTGDVDGSGTWSLGQLGAMADGLLNGFPAAAQKMAADLNADGKADMTDLVLAARLYIQEKPKRPAVELSPIPKESTAPTAAASASQDPEETQRARKTVLLVNEIRKEAGRQPLRMNADLNRAARVRVEEILAADKFSHERPDGRACQTVFEGPLLKGENLAIVSGRADDEVVEAVVHALKKSEEHLENMCLDCYTQMGAAYAKSADGAWYACHVFADSGRVVRVDTAVLKGTA